jgi:hypothetical protein
MPPIASTAPPSGRLGSIVVPASRVAGGDGDGGGVVVGGDGG